MSFGSEYFEESNLGKFAPLIKFYRLIFGIEDFHSHIRWDKVKRVISPKEKTLEIGAGNGIMSINYLKMFKKDIDLLVYDRKDLHVAKEIIDKLFSKQNQQLKPKINVYSGDAQYLEGIQSDYYDQVLLIDVLEHVDSPEKVVYQINRVLKIQGMVIVSVPTPSYLDFFGAKFDNMIGHKRHYTKQTISEAFAQGGFRLVKIEFYTGGLASRLCKLYYNQMGETKFKFLLMPVMLFLAKLSEMKPKPPFSSIIAVFAKEYNSAKGNHL